MLSSGVSYYATVANLISHCPVRYPWEIPLWVLALASLPVEPVNIHVSEFSTGFIRFPVTILFIQESQHFLIKETRQGLVGSDRALTQKGKSWLASLDAEESILKRRNENVCLGTKSRSRNVLGSTTGYDEEGGHVYTRELCEDRDTECRQKDELHHGRMKLAGKDDDRGKCGLYCTFLTLFQRHTCKYA